ncbi:hypothetical protein R1flu_004790 [Riccia fluitans]|uniref:Allene oxide synthase n=1 Tax=Riccia fluitans TaxID=41844 RepID=A0ABD1YRA6_9MARC
MADTVTELEKTVLPLREIPGSYGLPLIGAIRDKLDFYWFEQVPKFYESRRDKYQSTVFRTNVAPGPPGVFNNPRVVMLLDQKSYPVLFDVTKVEKKDVFTGTYVPSTSFTGGYRVLPYLDPSEEMHFKLKLFCFDILGRCLHRFFPEFHDAISDCFSDWEGTLANDGRVDFTKALSTATFKFNVKAFIGRDPFEPGLNSIGPRGPGMTKTWILAQIAPISVVPKSMLPSKLLIPLVELVLHTFPIPFAFVRGEYEKLIRFFRTYGGELLDVAQTQHGIGRDEAAHNLLFITLFNSWGGIDIFLPRMLKRLGALSPEAQLEIAADVRRVRKAIGGINLKALDEMELVKSLVYESLRIDPPIPYQYAHAKRDLIVESHESSFLVKKGEMLAGYMPLACKDPLVFSEPNKFLPKRFMGDGKQLLRYVLWSNGPETQETTLRNKQCAGKHIVPLIGRLLVAELYLRYDFLKIGDDGMLTSLIPAKEKWVF